MQDTKRYEPPSVTEYGGFEELTRGQGSLGGDGASQNGKGS